MFSPRLQDMFDAIPFPLKKFSSSRVPCRVERFLTQQSICASSFFEFVSSSRYIKGVSFPIEKVVSQQVVLYCTIPNSTTFTAGSHQEKFQRQKTICCYAPQPKQFDEENEGLHLG